MSDGDYDENYATCAETYATLRVYGVDPGLVTSTLGLTPESTQVRGTKKYSRDDSPRYQIDGWFLTSKGAVVSRDARHHLDWLLDRIEPAADSLQAIRDLGARVDVSCFWVSVSGHGGPTLSPRQAGRLAALDLECWFDVYVGDLLA